MTDRHEIILCSTPRSGSTLLAEAMYATRLMGYPDEFFNDDEGNKGDSDQTIMQKTWTQLGATGFVDYCDRLHDRYGSANLVHSVKMHFVQYSSVLEKGYFRRDVPRSFVWVRRHDKAAQAASLAIAIKTQKWNSRMTSQVTGDVEITDDLLARCYRRIVFDDLMWQAHFGIFGIAPLEFEYDGIVADLPGCLRRIADAAGVDLPDDTLAAVGKRIDGKKQAGDLNASLIARLSTMDIGAFGPGNILHDTGVLFA